MENLYNQTIKLKEEYKNAFAGSIFFLIFLLIIEILIFKKSFLAENIKWLWVAIFFIILLIIALFIHILIISKKSKKIAEKIDLYAKYDLEELLFKKILSIKQVDKTNKILENLYESLKQNIDSQIFTFQSKEIDEKISEIEKEILEEIEIIEKLEKEEKNLEKDFKNFNQNKQKDIEKLHNKIKNLKQISLEKINFYKKIIKKLYSLKQKELELKAQEKLEAYQNKISKLEQKILENTISDSYKKDDYQMFIEEKKEFFKIYNQLKEPLKTTENIETLTEMLKQFENNTSK